MITKKCTVSGNEFTITESDLEFYAKMEIISKEDLAKLKSREITDCVGLPTLCPEERQRRRLAWRNERKLYQRRCDLCEKITISMYDNNVEFPVYCENCWWSDEWDTRNFSRDFDFSRSFFEQFKELEQTVPHIALHVMSNENSAYVNSCGYSKNCYLSFQCDYSEGCLYCSSASHSTDCVDCLIADKSELCYEGINLNSCYNCLYSQNSKNCFDSYFLKSCIGCNNCFGCVNLRNKKYYFMNKPYSKEKYDKKVAEILNKNSHQQLRKHFQEFLAKFPQKFAEIQNSENCSGDNISNSKNTHNSYDCVGNEDCKFCCNFEHSKDCMDYDMGGYQSELCYEIGSGGDKNYNSVFSVNIWGKVRDSFFINIGKSLSDCFGCFGIYNKKYCILNKQYTKEEYFKLREKIIAHMKKTPFLNSNRQKTQGVEWGEFFPIELSPFAYNETVAQEYFPLTKEEILAKDWKYREEKQSFKYDGPKYEIPAKIEDVDDEILSKILTCEATGKYYKIQKAELNFYRKMNLPVPRLCPDERHKRRMALRNPRQLFSRECAECKKEIQTTFAPDRLEKVLCEECYLKNVN